MQTIQSRLPREAYDAIASLSITKLKELRRSPEHYQYALEHPRTSAPLTLGIACHVAVLEPERFVREFAVWDRLTEAGRMAPRTGQYWNAFCAENMGKTILTASERAIAWEVASAVRGNPAAMKYLFSGEPEVTLLWETQGRPCKSRPDWLSRIDGKPYLVGLKTARDCRAFVFGAQCAKLGYHLQFAFYSDAYEAITGERARLIEIVVESSPPHAVAVYRITEDVLAQGREEYLRLLDTLTECEATGDWPGPVPEEEDLTLPSWAYEGNDDIEELGLIGANS